MTIEFPCSNCRQLLRVPDASGGQQARCPQCGAVTAIPPSSPSPPAAADAPAGEEREGPRSREPPAAEQGYNPYASPTAAGRFEAAPGPAAFVERHGPPWERDGMGGRSLLVTLKELFFQPAMMFGGMRLGGGYWRPLAFAMLNTFLGVLVMVAFNVAFMAVMFAAMNAPGGMPQRVVWVYAAVYGGMLVLSPLYTALGCLLAAAAHHVALLAVGGANERFEATFRTAAYCWGAAHLLLAIPMCGGYIVIVPYVVYTCIGLSYVHNISGGKATVGGLVPVLVCCGTLIGSYVALVVLIVGASNM